MVNTLSVIILNVHLAVVSKKKLFTNKTIPIVSAANASIVDVVDITTVLRIFGERRLVLFVGRRGTMIDGIGRR